MNFLLGALIGLVLTLFIMFLNRNKRIDNSNLTPPRGLTREVVLALACGIVFSGMMVAGYGVVRGLALLFIGNSAFK